MIPADRVTVHSLEKLTQYLGQQIWRTQGERQPLEERWKKYDLAYRALPLEEEKAFPFIGAANLTIPVIATDVDTIFSRIMGILFAPENLWSCRPLNNSMVTYAPLLQEFLEWAQKHEVGAYNAIADFTLELCKLGTGVLKQRYRREIKQVYQFREMDGGSIQQVLQMLMKDSPVLEHVSLYDLYVPATARDIQSAPWVAERVKLDKSQLESRIRAGIYAYPPNGLNSWYVDRGSSMEQQRQTLDAFSPGLPDQCELFECWLDWDLMSDSHDEQEYMQQGVQTRYPQAIVATLHVPSHTLLRVDYNPFMNQERPYSFARYLRQDKRFYGIGLAEMLYMFQEEITTMHNQRLDSATLANSIMFKARKGSGIHENEPVFPGRIFLLDNTKDLEPMNMGQRYDSTVPYEQLSLEHGRRRTGVNDWIAGNSTPSTGYAAVGTATAMLTESAKRFDQVMREIRDSIGESGTRIVELYQQFNQRGKEFLVMGEEEGAAVHQVLQFPMELIRTSVSIEVTATSASANKDVEIRKNTVVFQMMMGYYQQMLQAMSYVANPQVPEPLRMLSLSMIQSGGILVKRILDSYGLQDSKDVIPKLEEILGNGQQTLNTIGTAFGGGTPGAQGLLPAGGMGSSDPGNSGAMGNVPY